ncbi:MAG: extracellular solute-binding protein [Spirochaetales bacterium]|nr:extracellular solute-binding protein [Spirochaetales bacterium]
MNIFYRLIPALLAVFLLGSCSRGPQKHITSEVEFHQEGFPIVDETVTIEIGALTGQTENQILENDFRIFDEMEELTNVKVKWRPISWDNLISKIILMFVSNDYPEAFMGFFHNPQDYQRMVDQGLLLPLDSYIEAGLMPNFSQKIAANPGMTESLVLNDGNLYSLPRFEETRSGGIGGIWHTLNLNKEWMDALNLEAPETLNELVEVLKAFRDGDPNGNGLDDEIPYSAYWSGGGNQNCLWPLLGAFGLQDNLTYQYMVRDGQVIPGYMQPEYKDAIKFFHYLYREELLDLEFISQNKEAFDSKLRNDKVGFWIEWPIVFNEPNSAGEDAVNIVKEKVLTIPPLKGPSGDNPIWPWVRVLPMGSLELTKKCKNPEVILRWADLFYDDYYGLQVRYGAWNQRLFKDEDGALYLKDPVDENFNIETITMNNAPFILNKPSAYGSFRRNPIDDYADQIFQQYVPYKAEDVMTFPVLPKAENKLVASFQADSRKLIENKVAMWITGDANIDEEWDDYIAELKKMGVEEIFSIYQKAYEQQRARREVN